jgi:hypothetical protein
LIARKTTLFLLLAAFAAGSVSEVHADGKLTAARELAEWALRKFSGNATREGTEALTRRIVTAAAKHGDDLVIAAVKKAGAKALTLADEAAEQAPRVLRFIGRYGDEGAALLTRKSMKLLTLGDDAAAALVRHQGVAEPLLESYGGSAVKALAAVAPRNGRRLAIMAEAGELAAFGRTPEVLSLFGKYGDPALEFVWRHKAALAGTAVLGAFLANPEPYLDGSNKLAETVAANAVKPAIVATGKVADEAAGFVRWSLTIVVVGLVAAAGLAWRGGASSKGRSRAGMVRSAFRFGRWLAK